MHVANSVTLPWGSTMRTVGRSWNQVENRCLVNGGSNRAADTPVVACTSLRTTEPGLAPTNRLAIGANRVASLPMRSV